MVLPRLRPSFVLALAVASLAAIRAPAVEFEPLGRGPYPVGSTNLEVTSAFANLSSDQREAILTRNDASGRYLSDFLRFPSDAFSFHVDVPQDPTLYGEASGRRLSFTGFITYPTTEDNNRANYVFPHDRPANATLERMQGPGDDPILHDPHARYPLIVSSHGGGVHPLHDASKCATFASHGYIALALVHGDGPVVLSRNALYGLRPLAVKKALDLILASDEFGPHIDHRRIGITGHSWGGLTALAAGGAKLFNNPAAVTDDRIGAIVGLEPSIFNSFGGSSRSSFGQGNAALAAIDKPYLHINGTQNTFPLPALDLVSGSVYFISLPGQPHVFQGPSWNDALNWELVFFAAHLKDDPEMLELLNTADSVAGFNADYQQFNKQKIRPLAAPTLAQAFGSSTPELRVIAPSDGPTAIAFPAATASSQPYYDLQYSTDGRSWLTLAAPERNGFVSDRAAPAGFAWRVLQDPRPVEQPGAPRFYRIRATR